MNKVVPIAAIALLATMGLATYALTVYVPGLNNNSTTGLGGPGTGTLNVYLTDSPHSNATLKYLLVNVTSLTLRYSEAGEGMNSTTTTTATATTNSTSSLTTTNSTSTFVSTSGDDATTDSTSTASGDDQNDTGTSFVFQVPASVGTSLNLTELQGNSILLGAAKAPAGNVTGIILSITGAKAYWADGNSTQLKVVADGKLMIPVHFTVFADGTTNLTVDITPNSIHVSPGNLTVLRPVVLVTVVQKNGTTVTAETTETESETTSTNSTST
jgi:Domain of unknown function (DUF4382)